MGDFKSKLPDLNELGSMAGKLFKGLKSSVNEIVDDYKKKREDKEGKEDKENKTSTETKTTKTTSSTPKDDDAKQEEK